MASFEKRGKGWQYTVSRVVNGKYDPIRKGGFRTKKEAEAEANEIENRLRKGILPRLQLIPFQQYFIDWLDIYKTDISGNTKARYLTTHKTIEADFNDTPIQHIDKRMYQQFLNRYAKSRTKTTVKKLNSHIRSCVNDAIDEGLIVVDFTRNVNITGLDGKPKIEKYLDYKEYVKFDKYIRMKIKTSLDELDLVGGNLETKYLTLLIAGSTGMRFGEIVGLTTDDFDFDNNYINIDKTWGYSKKMVAGFGKTKNKETRIVKVGPETMELVKRALPYLLPNDNKLIFYDPSSKYKVVGNSLINNLLKDITTSLGVQNITVHGLRHTHASVLLYKKVAIEYVSERLGHADINTTYSYYSHVLKELREEEEQKTVEIFV